MEQYREAEKIRSKIARLEVKMRNEVQFNIQLQLSAEIKALKKQLSDKT